MAEVGIDIGAELPKPWTDEVVQAADVVVTMGRGDACPLYPGKHYEDWSSTTLRLGIEAVAPSETTSAVAPRSFLGRLADDSAQRGYRVLVTR